ncbi:hypothetical protein [Actinomadura sp. 9N215]|uniref:hypothetical protein n=1 Tax=Actinomadura sp. 9N215 TaxID=3375150 RepID=UPI0037B6B059
MIRNSRRMVALAVAGAVAIAPVISGCGAGEDPQSAAPTQLTDGVNVSVPKDRPADAQIALRNVFLLGPRPGEPIPPGSSLALYGVMINQVKGGQDRLISVGSPVFGPGEVDGGRGLVLPGAAPDGTGTPVKLLGKASAKPNPAPPADTKTKKPGTRPSGQPGGQPGGATPEPGGAGATPEPTGATPVPEPTGTGTGTGAGATPEPTGAGTTPGTSTGPTSGNTGGAQATGAPTTPTGEQALVVLTGLKQELLAGSRVTVWMKFEKAGAVEFQVPLVPQQGEYSSYPLASPVGPATGSPNPGGAPQPGATGTTTQPGSPGHGSPQPGAGQPGAEQSGAPQSPGGGQSPGGSGH